VNMESMSMKRTAAFLIGFLILDVMLLGAHAQNDYFALGNGSQEPIDIKSKKVTARNIPNGRESIFEGNVTVSQDDVTLTCDRLTVVWDEKKGIAGTENKNKKRPKDFQTAGNIKSITASGNVKIVQDERMATAGKAVYDHIKRTITLTEGPPRVWQGSNVGTADTIVIHLDENSVAFGDRVQFTIKPSEQMKEK